MIWKLSNKEPSDMTFDEDDNDYEVGYRRPPKEHQFKKGGVARLALEQDSAGLQATLLWLLTPRQMLRIA